jgi:hypothetical protein
VPPEANDRELLRQTFNTAAAQYQEARPEYPGELYAATRSTRACRHPPASPGPTSSPTRRPRSASGLFTDVAVRRFDWEIRYTAEAYIRLLDTFSGHIAMADWQRDRLYGEIRRRLAARPGGQLRRHWGAVLHVARRV